jgi:hypothetical protein
VGRLWFRYSVEEIFRKALLDGMDGKGRKHQMLISLQRSDSRRSALDKNGKWEEAMKSLRLLIFGAMLTCSVPGGIVRAQQVPSSHHHYKVMDLGSFGGGNAYGQGVNLPYFPGTTILNRRGVVAAWGDTNTADPFGPIVT